MRLHTCTCCNCSSHSGEKMTNDKYTMTKIWQYHFETLLDYLWIQVHLCKFPLLQLSIYQNFLVEQYEAKVCIHQLSAFVEQQSCRTLNSCILNLLANEPLPFLFWWKWQTNLLTYLAQVFAGVLALITSILYFLAAAFAYKTIKDNMWILNIFTNISIQVLNYTLKTKTVLCDCYLCAIMKRYHLHKLNIANIDPRFCQTHCLKKRWTNYELQTMKVTMKSCCQLAPICGDAILDVNIRIWYPPCKLTILSLKPRKCFH